ncbi:hypothetical protein D3C87_1438460 [compost metagenome]
MQVGFQAQATPQFGHGQQRLHPAPAKAPIFGSEGHGGQAQLTELLPERWAKAQFAFGEALARFEIVAVAHQANDSVLQHLLLFGKFEVHDRFAPYNSRIILAMMFFWISLEPP